MFIGGFFRVATGAGVAQLLSFLAIPVIARLYEVDTVGQYNALFSYSMLGGVFLTFGFNRIVSNAVCVEEADWARKIYLKIWLWLLPFTLLFSMVDEYVFVCVLLSMFAGLVVVYESFLLRVKKFGSQSGVHITFSVINNFLKCSLSAGLSSVPGAGLSVATVISYFVKAILLISISGGFKSDFSGSIANYRNVFFYRFPQAVLAGIGAYFPVLSVYYIYGDHEAGLVGMSLGLLGVPVLLVGNAAFGILQTKYAESTISESFDSYLKSTVSLMVASFFGVFLFVGFGEVFLVLLLGDKWAGSYDFSVYIISWYAVMLISKPSYAAVSIVSKDRLSFWNELLFFVFKVFVFVFALFLDFDAHYYVGFISLISAFSYIVFSCLVYLEMKRFSRSKGGI